MTRVAAALIAVARPDRRRSSCPLGAAGGDARRPRHRQGDDADPGRGADRFLCQHRLPAGGRGFGRRGRDRRRAARQPAALRQSPPARGEHSGSPPGARRRRRSEDPVRGGVADSRLDLGQRPLRARSHAGAGFPFGAGAALGLLHRHRAARGGAARRPGHSRPRDRRLCRRGDSRRSGLRLPSLDRGLLRRSRMGLLGSAGEPEFRRRDLPATGFERRRERAARAGAAAVARQRARGDRSPGADAGAARPGARQRQRAPHRGAAGDRARIPRRGGRADRSRKAAAGRERARTVRRSSSDSCRRPTKCRSATADGWK